MTNGMDNRRREERYPVNTVVTLNEQLVMVKDLSRGGLRVTAMNLRPQQMVDLTIKTGQTEINMKALVRWVKRSFPFESYTDCGLALVSPPCAYRELYQDISVPPRLLPLFGLWPISLVALFSLALMLMVWV